VPFGAQKVAGVLLREVGIVLVVIFLELALNLQHISARFTLAIIKIKQFN
jgi:hypothetical protein